MITTATSKHAAPGISTARACQHRPEQPANNKPLVAMASPALPMMVGICRDCGCDVPGQAWSEGGAKCWRCR